MSDLTNWLTTFPVSADENGDTSVADQRQERIRKAFDSSKESYKNELVVLSPSFYRVELNNTVNTANNDRFGLQNIDASMQEAYTHQEYQRALDLCLAYLNGVEEGKIVLEGAGAARDREYFDTALRTCLRLPDLETGLTLIGRSRHLWKANYVVGMSAARIYIALGRPRDAISVLLASIPSTGIRHPFLKLLAVCFSLWCNNLTSSTLAESTKTFTVRSLCELLDGHCERASGPYYHGAPTVPPTQRLPGLEDAVIRAWCVSAELEGEELEALYALCTIKLSSTSEDSTDAVGERSVRTL